MVEVVVVDQNMFDNMLIHYIEEMMLEGIVVYRVEIVYTEDRFEGIVECMVGCTVVCMVVCRVESIVEYMVEGRVECRVEGMVGDKLDHMCEYYHNLG